MSSLPLQKSLYPLLRPLGAAYRVLMRARRRRYENGAACRTDVPCVSVGNIGWGGSGKTPVVQWLLQWAAGHGLHAVVLTRGYKASPPGLPYVVTPQSPAAHAGDEPLMLARSCPQGTVVVDPVRSRSARWAQERLDPDFFVLDDGFQHVQVARDTDLVLLKKDDLHAEWGIVPYCSTLAKRCKRCYPLYHNAPAGTAPGRTLFRTRFRRMRCTRLPLLQTGQAR